MNIYLDFIMCFIVMYLVFYYLVYKKHRTYNKKNPLKEMKYLTNVYNIDINNVDYKKLFRTFCLTNAFIISATYIIIFYSINGFIWQLSFGMIILILLTIVSYAIVGKIFKK